jgi:hypothetical protein
MGNGECKTQVVLLANAADSMVVAIGVCIYFSKSQLRLTFRLKDALALTTTSALWLGWALHFAWIVCLAVLFFLERLYRW